MFQDVTTLLLHPDAFQHSIDILYEHYKDEKIDVIAGKRDGIRHRIGKLQLESEIVLEEDVLKLEWR